MADDCDRRQQHSPQPRWPLDQGRPADGRRERPLRGRQGGEPGPVAGEGRRAHGRAGARFGREARRHARRDEGRGDEDGPARLVHRHRVPARRVPRALPGEAREAAHLGAGDAVEEGPQGARGGVRRALRRAVRRDRAGGVRGRLDRSGPPGDAARRPAGRGEDPVSGRRRGDPRRPLEHAHDPPVRARDRAGPRRQGGRGGAQGARQRGARLRVRGAEPAHVRARLPRPPVHLRAGRDRAAVTRPRARDRVRRGDRLRRDQAARLRRPAAASARSSSASTSGRSSSSCTSTPTPIRATTCCSTTGGWRSSTSA